MHSASKIWSYRVHGAHFQHGRQGSTKKGLAMVTDEIGRVAQSLLETKVEHLIDLSVARLLEDETGYQSINLADLRQQMQRTLTLALMRLSGQSIPPSLASAAYETGQLRAYQNLELSSVLHSFR